MMEFVVKRSEWYRGQGATWSRLLRSTDQKMCCLGFLARSCGYSNEDIDERGYFNDLTDTSKVPAVFFSESYLSLVGKVKYFNSAFADLVASTNDDPKIDDEERERHLTRLFAENGIQVKFED